MSRKFDKYREKILFGYFLIKKKMKKEKKQKNQKIREANVKTETKKKEDKLLQRTAKNTREAQTSQCRSVIQIRICVRSERQKKSRGRNERNRRREEKNTISFVLKLLLA